jgi:uroporphyrinogen-III synthase
MRLLITRPEEDGSRFAERLTALGHEPVLLPLISIVYSDAQLPPLGGVQALIATSRNALRGLAGTAAFGRAKHLPVYCVGEATASLAGDLGFRDIRPGEGTAKDLVPLIARTCRPDAGALFYLTGEHIAFDLSAVLVALRFTVRRAILYHAVENPDAAAALAAYLRHGPSGVILMSPRTAEIFAGHLKTIGQSAIRDMTCYCYSQAVAKPLEGFEGLRLLIAARPVEADLLDLLGDGAMVQARNAVTDEALGKR